MREEFILSRRFDKIPTVADHRLWRMRKLHQSVDAELHHVSETVVQVRFLYNGELAYVRSYSTRDGALGEAAAKRAELERDGWMFHW